MSKKEMKRLRDARGRFVAKKVRLAKRPVKAAVNKKIAIVKNSARSKKAPDKKLPVKKPAKKSAKKSAKKPAKRPAKKSAVRQHSLFVWVNDVRLGKRQGIRPTMRVVALVALTSVPVDRAIVRINGRNVSSQATVRLHEGDVVTVRRRVKKQSAKKVPKKQRKAHRVPKRKTELVKGKENSVVWVNVMDEEWIRKDGSVAVEASFVRLFPEADAWERRYRELATLWGEKSEPVRRLAEQIRKRTERPIQEIYTLFFSP